MGKIGVMSQVIIDSKTGTCYYAVKRRNLQGFSLEEHLFVKSLSDDNIFYPLTKDKSSDAIPETVYLTESDYLKYCQKVDLKVENPDYISRLEEAYVGAMILLRKKDIKPEAVSLCNRISDSIKNLKLTEGLAPVLEKLSKSSEIKKHMLRTLFCRILTSRLGWSNETNLQKIFMAALLAQIYPNPNDSADLLEKLGLNKDIVLAVRHHQENSDGTGPLKIKRHFIYPLSKVIRVSDELSKLFLEKKEPSEIRWALQSLSPDKLDASITKVALALWKA